MTLPNDVARCNGVGSDAEGWREGCSDCLRRTAARNERTWMIEPPEIIVFECASRLAPEELSHEPQPT